MLNIEAASAEGRHAHSFIFIRPSHYMIQCMGHRPTAPLPLGSGLLTQNDTLLHIPNRESQMPHQCFRLAGRLRLSLK